MRQHRRSSASTTATSAASRRSSAVPLASVLLLAGIASAFQFAAPRGFASTARTTRISPIANDDIIDAVGPVGLAMSKAPTEAETEKSSSKEEEKSKHRKQTHSTETIEKDPDDETTEKIFGAEFFGGNKQKEELFDPVAEERAAELARQERDAMQLDGGQTTYARFDDADCFPDDEARDVGRRLQAAVNGALYEEDELVSNIYSPDVSWTTPFPRAGKESQTPLDELANALDFYNRIDVAIVGAKSLPTKDGSSSKKEMEVRWEISVVWPNPWEARVLLTGTSRITLDGATSSIVSQTDLLDGGSDVVTAVGSQVVPRFWDAYHIGMTPSAELTPRISPTGEAAKKKGLLSGPYELSVVPPRLVVRPTLLDLGGREERAAQSVPNHSFSTIIKTTGPNKQRYVPTSPVEVAISRDSKDAGGKSRITWSIPIPPEVLAAAGPGGELPLPAPDVETPEDREATSTYLLQPRRLVATVPYGGNPQDEDVSEVRRVLYEAVTKDGLRPRVGEDGRPRFFFWQNDAKACYVADGGLGMAVYEWRPKSVKGNEVGIELEEM